MMEYKTVTVSKPYKDEKVFILVELDRDNPYKNSFVKTVVSSYSENGKYLGKSVFSIIEEYGDEFGLVTAIQRALNADASKTL